MGLIAGHEISVTLTGDASLTKRPMNRVIKPLEMMGATFKSSEGGRLPLTINGTNEILPLEYTLPMASAQVKSAILLAGLTARGETTVIEPKPTRDHTENMLTHFGVDIKTEKTEDGHYRVTLKGQQELQPCAIDVPGDPSSAAFLAVAAALNKGSELRIARVCMNDRRNGLYLTLQDMGANIKFEYDRIESGERVCDIIIKGSETLNGTNVPQDRVPSMVDEFPILAMAAACAKGTTKMTGLAELRVKECDRLLVVYEGLMACGVNAEMGEDSLTIHGTGNPPRGLEDGAIIKTELDHRIAMSFLILGTVTENPIKIDDGAPIRTSFPNFIELMNDFGADIKVSG